MASLPEMPFAGRKDIQGKRQVSNGMGKHTLGEAAGPVENQIIGSTRHHTSHYEIMLQAEQQHSQQE